MIFTKYDRALMSVTGAVIESRQGLVELSEILEPYDRGVSINRLSFELKISEPFIRKTLIANGVEIRNQTQAANHWSL